MAPHQHKNLNDNINARKEQRKKSKYRLQRKTIAKIRYCSEVEVPSDSNAETTQINHLQSVAKSMIKRFLTDFKKLPGNNDENSGDADTATIDQDHGIRIVNSTDTKCTVWCRHPTEKDSLIELIIDSQLIGIEQ